MRSDAEDNAWAARSIIDTGQWNRTIHKMMPVDESCAAGVEGGEA